MFAKSTKPLVLTINDNVADLISEIQSLSSRKRIKNTVVALERQKVDKILEDIKRSKIEGEWLICNCIDVDNGLVQKILHELRTDSHNINENFRMWICSLWNEYEEQPILPKALLLHSEKYLREGAKDFEAQVESIFKSHYIRDAYGHIDNLQWKKVIYSVSLFHSIVVKKFATRGYHDGTKLITIDRKTLKSTFKILEAIVERVTAKTIKFDDRYLSHIIGEVIYGGFAQNMEVLNDFMKLGDMLFIDQRTKASNDVFSPLTIMNHDTGASDFFLTFATMEKSVSEIEQRSYIELMDKVVANLSSEAFRRTQKK